MLGETEQVFARAHRLTDWVRYLYDDLDDVSKGIDPDNRGTRADSVIGAELIKSRPLLLSDQ